MIDYFCVRDYAAVDPIVARRFLYLVFDYMDTTLWREFQTRKGLFDRQMIIRIFGDVCRGVKHVHDLGIVHTDLSANNLLYSQGRLKVADLGCSSCAATWVLPTSERGTAHSRAPELWLAFAGKHASTVPAASQLPLTIPTAIDCWSLGVCLGMLLTGQFIFETFAAIVSCLGPLTDKEWPGCTSLPGYKTSKVAQLSEKFKGRDTHVLNFFSSAKHVKYPKPVEDSGLDLISMFLKWPPKRRCTVQQSLDHSFFRDIRDVDGMLHGCSHEQLGQLVKDSIQNGVPVSSFDIVPPTKPASSRGIKRAVLVERHSQAENNSSGAPAVVPELACEVQDVDESLCACRGNCLSVACKKAAYKVNRWRKLTNDARDKAQRQICKQPRMSEMRVLFSLQV